MLKPDFRLFMKTFYDLFDKSLKHNFLFVLLAILQPCALQSRITVERPTTGSTTTMNRAVNSMTKTNMKHFEKYCDFYFRIDGLFLLRGIIKMMESQRPPL